MLGLSRWTEKGGSYRTVQRFFYTVIPWAQVFWTFFSVHLIDQQDTYLLAGDESVVTKAGDKTHGLDFFFSGLLKKAIPGLLFFTLALISTQQRRSYPICVEQMIRTEEEKTNVQVKKQAKKAKSAGPKGKPGRPKGSRNKNKAEVDLNPELMRIQKMVQSCFLTLNWSPPWGKINFRNEPTWTLQSPVYQDRRQGDEKGGRLRTDTQSVSY